MIVDDLDLLNLAVFAKEAIESVFVHLEEEVTNINNVCLSLDPGGSCRRDALVYPDQEMHQIVHVYTPFSFEPEN